MAARSIVASLLLALLPTGCDDGGYAVRVAVPGGAARATRVDVYVLESCSEVAAPGDRPAAPLVSVEAVGGDAALGHLAPGTYGLYGRAWESGCRMFAAGCAAMQVQAGGSGTRSVTLVELDPPRGCDPGEACHADACAPGDGGVDCVHDVDCDDGIDCTRDVCPDDGTCLHAPDSDACGDQELCFAPIGCIPRRPCEDASDCDDDNPCSGVETCEDGTCLPSMAVVCDDGDFCNGLERCEPLANGCVDGDPPTCSDGIDCTVDGCSGGACTNVPDDARCDDDTFCNGAESCDAVLGCLPGASPCDDAFACTVDQCVEADGECLHHADHGLCEATELCADTGAGYECQIVDCSGDEDCDDTNLCNGVETCGGDLHCVASFFAPCDDGVFCNGAEYCSGGACETQEPPGCSDGVDCTVDVCDATADACVGAPADDRCDDGLACTADACGALGCVGPPLDCDDGSACTVDGCSEQADGCTTSIVDRDGDGRGDAACGGTDCDDANAFTFPGAAEACNADDDDCDGELDETFACSQGAPGSCTTTCGSTGTTTCTGQCDFQGPCAPPPEDCNGADDDCDGATDEGCDCVVGQEGSCTTPCGSTGSRTCADGTWSPCAAPAEVCNGADDDCDGLADDGFACVPGVSGPCQSPCATPGTRVCQDDCTWSSCAPPPESCDGHDEDCDGSIDEDFTCVQGSTGGCTTGCASTGRRDCGQTCVWGACVPPAEACNGADDDCDGACDDGFDCCAGGVAGGCLSRCNTWGIFRCTEQCFASDTCTPPAETCNGRDDDCDALCDENFACCQGRRTACIVAPGVQGYQLCKQDCVLGSCCADSEVCGNGVDDDCDGPIDELGCCQLASPEVCNGADDDCNGLCDDSFSCCRGATEPCTTSCNSIGQRACSNLCTWTACTPPPEVCGNHVDDDCDGEIDELGLCGGVGI